MKKYPLLGFGAVLSLVVAAPLAVPLAAQQEAPPVYFVYQEYVKPPMLMQYEAVTKEMVAALKEAGVTEAGWSTISGPDLGYAYVMPVDGLGGLGDLFATWQAATSKVAGWSELEARAAATVDHGAASILMLRPDLSHMVESTAIAGERPFRKYHWWYVMPGKQGELEQVAKDYVSLYESKGIDAGFRLYQALMGPELPMYLVVENAASEADYHSKMAEVRAALGEEEMKLQMRALQVARRIEVMEGMVRPELSFVP